MQTSTRVAAVIGAFVAAMSVAGPSIAQQDIPWTWNSGDHDGRAKFVAEGEVYHGIEYSHSAYVNWSATGSGSGRWYIPGTGSGAEHTLNLDFPEGKSVTLKVCEEKSGLPDDCSGTKTGVS